MKYVKLCYKFFLFFQYQFKMLKCLNNEKKNQMRQNIKQHRQKLLQLLEDSDDTILKPKIKLISKSIEKSNLNHHAKPIIASSAKLLNQKTTSTVGEKQIKPVINTKEKYLEVLTDDTKKYLTRSNVTVNQLKHPNIRVNKQEELNLSNVELQLGPIPNNEINNPEPSPVILKKLKDQLLEELNYSSNSEETEEDISVGDEKDLSELVQTYIESDNSNSSLIEEDEYDGHKQPSDEEQCKYQFFFFIKYKLYNYFVTY